jgi:hypothetical protein
MSPQCHGIDISSEGSSGRSFMKIRVIVGVIVLLAAYAITIALYASTGLGHPSQLIQSRPTADGTIVTIDFNEVHSVKGEMVANVTVAPGSKLLDPTTGGLTEDLGIAVHSAVTPTRRNWSKGMVPGVFPVALTLSGDPGDYPFDRYESGPITVDLFHGGSPIPERVAPAIFDLTAGWMFNIPIEDKSAGPEVYRVHVLRSPSTGAFATVILGALITIATLGVVVAIQTARKARKFQPPMMTWFAALVFAVVPLRNALPDAPPMGTWIDITIVLWVIVALVASMGIYIACWWRDTAQ